MKNTPFSLLTFVALMLLFPANSNADLLWTFTDDGNGNIREQLSGTLDMSAGINVGTTGVGGEFSMFQDDQFDLVQVHRYTTVTTGRSWYQIFDGYDTNPDMEMVNTTGRTTPGWQNTNHLLLQIYNDFNQFRVGDFAGTFAGGPTAISEDVVHNVPFSFINEGVWRYGNLDDDIEGNGMMFIVGNPSSVPEPSSCLIVASILGCTLLRRKK